MMSLADMNPFDKRLIKEWKGCRARFEPKNPKKPVIIGEIIDVNVHKCIFMVRTEENVEVLIPMTGLRIVERIVEDNPECLPGKSSLKEYNRIPVA